MLSDSFKESLDSGIGTNECAKNSYTIPSAIESVPEGKRIDFIMHRPGYKYEVYT